MLKKISITLLVLVLFGLARAPFEQALEKDLRATRLLPPELDTNTRNKLGQNSYAIVLGGLRSTVAAMMNLEAFDHFGDQDWDSVDESYQTITTLQPYSSYYWETASWHLAYNAYSDYGDRIGLPNAYRRQRQREYLTKGSAYLEEGCRQNPDDWKLKRQLAFLWSNHLKKPDYPRAAQYYEEALAIPGASSNLKREYIYTLAHVPGREAEVLQYLQETADQPHGSLSFPTTRCLYFVFQEKNNLPSFAKKHLLDIFQNRQQALGDLSNYYIRSKKIGLPIDGVVPVIRQLELDLGTPAKNSALRNPKAIPLQPGKR